MVCHKDARGQELRILDLEAAILGREAAILHRHRRLLLLGREAAKKSVLNGTTVGVHVGKSTKTVNSMLSYVHEELWIRRFPKKLSTSSS